MSNSIQLETRIRAIAEELEKGISTTEIVQHYASKWNMEESTLFRYITLAKDIVVKRMNDNESVLEALRGTVVAEEYAEKLRSNLELEAKVVSLIEGDMEVEKIISKKDGVTEVRSKPSRNLTLKAIDLLWKRKGAYIKKRDDKDEKSEEFIRPVIKVQNEEQKGLVERIMNLPLNKEPVRMPARKIHSGGAKRPGGQEMKKYEKIRSNQCYQCATTGKC